MTDDEAFMRAMLVGAPDDEIVGLEAAIRRAQLAADVAALDALISDDLLFTGPDGRIGSKREDLDAHGSGLVRFRVHEPEELRVRRIGTNVAVVALRARLAVEVGGVLHEGTFRYTRVWTREDGERWRVVAGHVSGVAPAEANRQSRDGMLERYGNLSADSGVESYEAGPGWIKVRFHKGPTYVYDSVRPGAEHVARMQELARAGRGLSTYISQHVRDAYARTEA